jgi:hypothetical protein
MSFENDEDYHPVCNFCFEQLNGLNEEADFFQEFQSDVGLIDLYSNEETLLGSRSCSLPSTPEIYSSEKPKYCSDHLQ